MTATEERLVRLLNAVAEQTTPERDWDRVVQDADSEAGASSPLRPRVLAVAAMIALVVGGGVFLLNLADESATIDATQLSPFVLPGEVVLSLDPLTVTPAPSPDVRFDTSDLGTEIVVEPLTEIDELTQRSIDFQTDSRDGATITKLTLLGMVDDSPYVQLVTDTQDETGGNLREVQVLGPVGGGGSGDIVDPNGTDLLQPPEGGFSAAYTASGGQVIWEVRQDTAAVTFSSDARRLWVRPSGGYAIFPTSLVDGEEFTLQAFGPDGELTNEHSETVRLPNATSEPSVDPQVGDKFDVLGARDERGRQVVVATNGNPIVLIYGADWCPPCEEVAEQGQPLAAALDPSVRLFLVSADPDAPWSGPDRWDQPQIRLEDLGPVDAFPAIIVLDGERRVVTYRTGVDGVMEALGSVNDLVDD